LLAGSSSLCGRAPAHPQLNRRPDPENVKQLDGAQQGEVLALAVARGQNEAVSTFCSMLACR
jgi:ankyrin repeat protein